MLNGYKTYIAAFGLILFALYGLETKHFTSDQAWPLILQGLGLAGLRNALP